MKKLSVSMLAALLCVTASCGGKTSTTDNKSNSTSTKPTTSVTDGQSTTTTTPTPSVVVKSVKITDSDGNDVNTNVFDGTTTILKAAVEADKAGLKVTWGTSDDSVATVVNGVVKFKQISGDKTVTITATSRDDNTKKADVTFTVKHCIFDIINAKGNPDLSLYGTDGTVDTEMGDTALIFSDIYTNKWYVEAELNIDKFSESDLYPKVGIMTGTERGNWNNTSDSLTVKNAFFFADTTAGEKASGWKNFSFVAQNDTHTDWAWGNQKGAFSVADADKVQFTTPHKIGLLRNGTDYYLFTELGGKMHCYSHVVYDDISATDPSYVWLGGWSAGYVAGNIKYAVGDDVNQYFDTPTSLSVNNELTLPVNEGYQIYPETDVKCFDKGAVTYTSNNENVVVTKDGYIEACATNQTAKITVKLGELEQVIDVTITDDPFFKVAIDGAMDDPIYTATVKSNKVQLNNVNGDNSQTIDLYGVKNSRGMYLFADYAVKNIKNNNTHGNWWENDNFEIRVGNYSNGDIAGQIWVSGNNTSNATEWKVTEAVLDEGSGLYKSRYELFISYEQLKMKATDDIMITLLGSNSAAGWKTYASSTTKGALSAYARVTADGLLDVAKSEVISGTEKLTDPIAIDYSTNNGWIDNQTNWAKIAENLEGDFTVTVQYEMEGSVGVTFGVAKTIYPVIYNTENNDRAVYRFDWFAWREDINTDGTHIGEVDKGEIYVDNFDADMPNVLAKCNVTQKYQRVGNQIIILTIIKPTAEGYSDKTYTLLQKLNNVTASNVGISFAGENCKATITSIKQQ